MDTRIRRAMTADLPQLGQLFDRYRVFYHYPSDVPGGMAFLTERLQHNDAVIFVAEKSGGRLAGFTQLYPLFSSTRMKRLWLLNDLYVDTSCRGQGISKSLIGAAKNLAHETRACGLLLETAKSNEIGNRLYPSVGFHLEADSHYYYWRAPGEQE